MDEAVALEVPAAAVAPGFATVLVLVGNVGLGILAMTISLPSMPAWETVFGASQSAVQATYGAYLASFALVQLLCGPLSDRLGRRPVLLAGLTVFIAASLLCAVAPGIEVLILGRALQGAGACAGAVVGRALVQDVCLGADRTRVLAYTGIAIGVAAPVGAVAGGHLFLLAGWQSAFLVAAALGVGLLVASLRLVPRQPRRQAASALSTFSGYLRLVRSLGFLSYVITIAGCTATFYAYLGGAPAVLGPLGVGVETVGWYIFFCSGAFILGNFATSRLAWRTPDRRLFLTGQAVCLLGTGTMLALALAGNRSALLFAMPMLVVGFGHGLIQPPALRGATEVSAGDVGAAAAVGGAVQQAGGAAAGYALTLVSTLDQVSLAAIMVAAALASFAANLPHLRASG